MKDSSRAWYDRMKGGYSRSTAEAKEQYNQSWVNVNYDKLLSDYDGDEVLSFIKWDRNYFTVNINVVAQIHLLAIWKIIYALKPESVFEVGLRTVNKLLPLGGGFPEVQFGGLELSDAGFQEASRIAEEALPTPLLDFITLPVVDIEA